MAAQPHPDRIPLFSAYIFLYVTHNEYNKSAECGCPGSYDDFSAYCALTTRRAVKVDFAVSSTCEIRRVHGKNDHMYIRDFSI